MCCNNGKFGSQESQGKTNRDDADCGASWHAGISAPEGLGMQDKRLCKGVIITALGMDYKNNTKVRTSVTQRQWTPTVLGSISDADKFEGSCSISSIIKKFLFSLSHKFTVVRVPIPRECNRHDSGLLD